MGIWWKIWEKRKFIKLQLNLIDVSNVRAWLTMRDKIRNHVKIINGVCWHVITYCPSIYLEFRGIARAVN